MHPRSENAAAMRQGADAKFRVRGFGARGANRPHVGKVSPDTTCVEAKTGAEANLFRPEETWIIGAFGLEPNASPVIRTIRKGRGNLKYCELRQGDSENAASSCQGRQGKSHATDSE